MSYLGNKEIAQRKLLVSFACNGVLNSWAHSDTQKLLIIYKRFIEQCYTNSQYKIPKSN